MKRIILGTAIFFGFLTAMTAQERPQPTKLRAQQNFEQKGLDRKQVAAKKHVPSQDYHEVQVSKIPTTVKNAIAEDFYGATISKAYANAQEEYKVELTMTDGKKAMVYMNNRGGLLKNELKTQ